MKKNKKFDDTKLVSLVGIIILTILVTVRWCVTFITHPDPLINGMVPSILISITYIFALSMFIPELIKSSKEES